MGDGECLVHGALRIYGVGHDELDPIVLERVFVFRVSLFRASQRVDVAVCAVDIDTDDAGSFPRYGEVFTFDLNLSSRLNRTDRRLRRERRRVVKDAR